MDYEAQRAIDESRRLEKEWADKFRSTFNSDSPLCFECGEERLKSTPKGAFYVCSECKTRVPSACLQSLVDWYGFGLDFRERGLVWEKTKVEWRREVKQDYMASAAWRFQKKRGKKWNDSCILCGGQGLLCCHHLHYRTLFMERSIDLIMLCWDCHSELHKSMWRMFCLECDKFIKKGSFFCYECWWKILYSYDFYKFLRSFLRESNGSGSKEIRRMYDNKTDGIVMFSGAPDVFDFDLEEVPELVEFGENVFYRGEGIDTWNEWVTGLTDLFRYMMYKDSPFARGAK